MIRSLTAGLALGALLSGAAFADIIEVKMLNKGTDGERMVFEPDFVQAQPGDTIKFLASDKGHNAEIAKDMLPEGAEGFKGKINEEIEYTVEAEGLYGVICKPHYAMGMVMTIAVGEVSDAGDYPQGRVPKKAKARFEEQLENLN